MNLPGAVHDSRIHGVSGGVIVTAIVLIVIAVGATFVYADRPVTTTAASIPTLSHTLTSNSASLASSTATSTTTTIDPNAVQIVVADGGSENDDGATRFNPRVVTLVIGVNNTVVWINQDSIPHNVLSPTGAFYSGDLSTGQSYTFTFTTAGTYPFHDGYYPVMDGVITVLNP